MHRARFFTSALLAAAAVVLSAESLSAKLVSSTEQKAGMVAKAVPVSEKWHQRLKDASGRDNDYADETALLVKKAGGYENSILNDMAILYDVALLAVYGRHRDAAYFLAIDEFDKAADQLDAADRKRYYTAKARLRSGLQAPSSGSSAPQWFRSLAADCRRAVRYGCDAKTCAALLRNFAEKNGIDDRPLNESLCRISQEHARWFVTEAGRLHRAREHEKAYRLALEGIKAIAPLTVLADPDGCTRWRAEGVLLSRYDSLFVKPLCAAAGDARKTDGIRIAACNRYWQHRHLVAAVLPRVATPSSAAFALFKKAGEDERLALDVRIAAAEMRLWEKAGKLDEFKKRYPQRFGLAQKNNGKKKNR